MLTTSILRTEPIKAIIIPVKQKINTYIVGKVIHRCLVNTCMIRSTQNPGSVSKLRTKERESKSNANGREDEHCSQKNIKPETARECRRHQFLYAPSQRIHQQGKFAQC